MGNVIPRTWIKIPISQDILEIPFANAYIVYDAYDPSAPPIELDISYCKEEINIFEPSAPPIESDISYHKEETTNFEPSAPPFELVISHCKNATNNFELDVYAKPRVICRINNYNVLKLSTGMTGVAYSY